MFCTAYFTPTPIAVRRRVLQVGMRPTPCSRAQMRRELLAGGLHASTVWALFEALGLPERPNAQEVLRQRVSSEVTRAQKALERGRTSLVRQATCGRFGSRLPPKDGMKLRAVKKSHAPRLAGSQASTIAPIASREAWSREPQQ